jgi:predicted small secreted protein
MKPSTILRRGLVALALLAAPFVTGCNTYHYFDIDVEWGPVTPTQASQLQLCVLLVSGADTHQGDFPSNVVGLDPNDPNQKSICPPQSTSSPKMGTFEYSTFTDSGSLTFTVNGYGKVTASNDLLCTTGSTTMTASSQITQSGTITMGSFDTNKCPSMITQP